MNTFVTIQEFQRFKKVTYYTVQIEDHELTETDKFLEAMEKEKEYQEEFSNLIDWLSEIGDKRGARDHLFRHEGIAVALPPDRKYQSDELEVKEIRLYCHRVTPEVVILFNGGIKTARYPQDCPNVNTHFRQANHYIRQLDKIGINTDGSIITNLPELEIYY